MIVSLINELTPHFCYNFMHILFVGQLRIVAMTLYVFCIYIILLTMCNLLLLNIMP